MKTPFCITLVALLLPTGVTFAQGNLTPPAAPGPMMKTLQQIEPRTDVLRLGHDDESQYLISAPGSYYLTTNIIGSNDAFVCGIKITANNVTLDLNGFALLGNGSFHSGILLFGGITNVSISNGSASEWGECGVRGDGNGYPCSNSRFERLSLSANTFYGLSGVGQSQVILCEATQNDSDGFSIYDSTTLVDCSSSGNNGSGFSLGQYCVLNKCVATANSGAGFGTGLHNTLRDCTAGNNNSDGFDPAEGTSMTGCKSVGNKGYGYNSSENCIFTECTAMNNANHGFYPYNNCIMQTCIAIGNTNWGFSANWMTCVIKDCVAKNNSGGGILLGSRCVAQNNTSSGNTGVGIFSVGDLNRIDSNTAIANTSYGIQVVGNKNIIVRNHASADVGSAGFNITSGNTYGALVPLGSGQITSATGWENFVSVSP